MSPAASLLLLTDGRFPAGGYAHSGGLEASVRAGRVDDPATLEAFLRGRARTTGLMAGAFAAAACRSVPDAARLAELDVELDARTPAPALREASRTLGRQLVLAMRHIHPHPCLACLPAAPHHPIALGAAVSALGLGAPSAALAALYDAVTGPAAAAVKLLPVDPFTVHAILARMAGVLEALSTTAARCADAAPSDLPATGAPLLDIAAQSHAGAEGRLFAS